MCLFAEKDINVYAFKWMKRQLEQHYENSIFFINEPGRLKEVCFTDMASIILSEQWYKMGKRILMMKK